MVQTIKRFLNILMHKERGGPSGYHHLLAVILALFFLCLMPVLSQVSTFHSDERFYTDSALYMIQHGDYLTPHYPDGTLRLNKPILTYWALVASYATFGINYFAARLPFLLAACAMLWLTYQMALRLFSSNRTALFAVAILASNVQFISISLRATPDMLQTLFLNLSLYGFIGLLFNNDSRLRNYLWAYLGVALAIETKGLLGVVPIVFILICVLISKKGSDRVERMTHWPIVILATIVAAAWYISIYLLHSDGALGQFYQDQLGDRFSGSKFYILNNIFDYLWGVFRHFMPWSLLLLAGLGVCRNHIMSYFNHNKREIGFVLGWFVLLLVIFIEGNISRTRYLIPAYPLLSILIASILSHIWDDTRLQLFWRWCCRGIYTLMATAGLVLVLGGIFLHWKFLIAGAVLMVSVLWVLIVTLKERSALSPLIVAAALFMVTACGRALVLPVFEFAPSKKITACILQTPDITTPASVWLEKGHNFAGQLYLLSKGRIKAQRFQSATVPGNMGHKNLAVLSGRSREALDMTRYEATPCGAVARSAELNTLWQAFRSGGKDAFFKAIQDPIYLVRRRK